MVCYIVLYLHLSGINYYSIGGTTDKWAAQTEEAAVETPVKAEPEEQPGWHWGADGWRWGYENAAPEKKDEPKATTTQAETSWSSTVAGYGQHDAYSQVSQAPTTQYDPYTQQDQAASQYQYPWARDKAQLEPAKKKSR